MTKPRFEEFRFKGADDADLRQRVNTITSRRRRVYAPTGYETIGADQRLGVYVTTPLDPQGEELVIRTTAFTDDNGRESGAVFDALIADATGRRVIAANAPGVDYSKTMDPTFETNQELSPDQIEELTQHGMHSGFIRTGDAVMNAIHYTAHELDISRQYILTASSMGVALGAGMLRSALENNHDVKGVTLAEPVNHVARRLPGFAKDFLVSGSRQPGYLAMNPDVLSELDEPPLKWMERVVEDRKANWTYARALGKGSFYLDLGAVDGLEEVPVYLTRGAGSRLSQAAPFAGMVAKFKRVGGDYVDDRTFGDNVANPHDHPYTMTVQSVIDGVNNVINRAAQV